MAWAPDRGIAKVEVQVDDGDWQECRLGETASENTWVQWVYEWEATAGDHRLRVRATDATGRTQTEERADPAPDGATGWHRTQGESGSCVRPVSALGNGSDVSCRISCQERFRRGRSGRRAWFRDR